MPKPPSTDDLIILKMEIDTAREIACNLFDSLSQRIDKLIPEIPDRPPVSDWRKEVKSWPSWRKLSRKP